jgi:Protein of unknown function (DUF3800)
MSPLAEEATRTYNVYCDESCHLEHDGQKAMVIGAIWCSALHATSHARDFRGIKIKHGLDPHFEIKWTKVSESKIDFYLEILEKFFGSPDLRFRAIIVPDKAKLDHTAHGQSHEEWYYKMYFDMLKFLISPSAKYSGSSPQNSLKQYVRFFANNRRENAGYSFS